jgi:hypothetical protein
VQRQEARPVSDALPHMCGTRTTGMTNKQQHAHSRQCIREQIAPSSRPPAPRQRTWAAMRSSNARKWSSARNTQASARLGCCTVVCGKTNERNKLAYRVSTRDAKPYTRHSQNKNYATTWESHTAATAQAEQQHVQDGPKALRKPKNARVIQARPCYTKHVNATKSSDTILAVVQPSSRGADEFDQHKRTHRLKRVLVLVKISPNEKNGRRVGLLCLQQLIRVRQSRQLRAKRATQGHM